MFNSFVNSLMESRHVKRICIKFVLIKLQNTGMFYGIFQTFLVIVDHFYDLLHKDELNFGVEYLGFYFSPSWALVDLSFIISLITT
jgi:hypothetical protein